MKKLIVLLFLAATVMSSCDGDGFLSQAQELKILTELYTEIQELAGSQDCINPEEWAYTALGSKACGGPVSYIAYPLTIDVIAFLEKVEQYTLMQEEFNTKWGIVSDCSLIPEPLGVECIEGVAELIY